MHDRHTMDMLHVYHTLRMFDGKLVLLYFMATRLVFYTDPFLDAQHMLYRNQHPPPTKRRPLSTNHTPTIVAYCRHFPPQ